MTTYCKKNNDSKSYHGTHGPATSHSRSLPLILRTSASPCSKYGVPHRALPQELQDSLPAPGHESKYQMRRFPPVLWGIRQSAPDLQPTSNAPQATQPVTNCRLDSSTVSRIFLRLHRQLRTVPAKILLLLVLGRPQPVSLRLLPAAAAFIALLICKRSDCKLGTSTLVLILPTFLRLLSFIIVSVIRALDRPRPTPSRKIPRLPTFLFEAEPYFASSTQKVLTPCYCVQLIPARCCFNFRLWQLILRRLGRRP